MDEQKVRQIIQEELGKLFNKSDRFIFEKDIEVANGRVIKFSANQGTKIGTTVDQKLAFWGATPVDRPAFISDPSGVTLHQDNEARVKIASILDLLIEIGVMRSS